MKTLVLLLLLAVPAASQCPLVKPPALRGLRLGMSLKEVQAIYPKAEKDVYEKRSFVLLNPTDIADAALRSNIKNIHVDLSDSDRVTDITVQYTADIAWSSTKEFTDKISPFLDVPERYWYCPSELRCTLPFVQRSLSCEGFELSATFLPGSPQLWLRGPKRTLENKKAFRP